MAVFLKKSKILDNKNKPLVKIVVLNIMPKLEDVEHQLFKVLDTSMLDVKLDFVYLDNFTKDLDKLKYLKKNYLAFSHIKNKEYDGAIITGAPLEHFEYKDINYINELNEFLEYTQKHVKTTLFICWASIYALNYFYQVRKIDLPNKLSGLYEHYVINETNIVKGLNEYFFIPISRYSAVLEQDVLSNKDLILVSKSNIAGPFIIESANHKQLFFTGHAEYEKNTLELEYLRDLKMKLNVQEPINYYKENKINHCWYSTSLILFHNWLYDYVFNGYE